MKHKSTNPLYALLSVVIMVVFIVFGYPIIALYLGLHSRSDNVVVKAIDDFYEIAIYSSGKWYIPISAEGLFPEWSDSTYMVTIKDGIKVKIDGVLFKKFVIGEDIEVRLNKFSKGEIFLSESDKILRIKAKLGRDYKWTDSVNHSGEYRQINIERPKIVTINSSSIIQDLMGSHIRVVGHFRNHGDSGVRQS